MEGEKNGWIFNVFFEGKANWIWLYTLSIYYINGKMEPPLFGVKKEKKQRSRFLRGEQ